MYNVYNSIFTTYERVNAQLKSNPTEGDLTDDQTIVEYYIKAASRDVAQFCNRTFVPYIRNDVTVKYDQLSPYWVLSLPDDGLVISSIAGDSGSVLPTDQYILMDILQTDNGYPYRWVEISRESNIYINITRWDYVPRFTIDGIWGYSDQSYANSWETVSTTSATITDSAVTFVVADSSLFEIFDFIRLESEFMLVTGNDTNTDTLTVTRGVNGSTAAAHDGSVTAINVERWLINTAIQDATTHLAAYLYTSRQATGSTLVFGDGTVATQYPALVRSTLFNYKKPIILSV